MELLLIDTIEESLIKKIDRKNCDEVSTPSQFYIS